MSDTAWMVIVALLSVVSCAGALAGIAVLALGLPALFVVGLIVAAYRK